MALDKLTILVELPGGRLQFDENNADCCIAAMFNPERLTISRSAQWQSQEAARRDSPELQFTTAEPSVLSVELCFDTYDSPEPVKQSVATFTSKLVHLTTVETHGDKHRPPICQLKWGSAGVFFQGVLQQLVHQYTLFMEDGTPVRATARCIFRQWRTNAADLQRQNIMSSDVAKVWVLRQGQTLAAIAAQEYGDADRWRAIADANAIDDPLKLPVGSVLVLPALRQASSTRAMP